MTIRFTKNITLNDLSAEYGNYDVIILDIIHHMETKFEALEEKIGSSQGKLSFEENWVYKNGHGEDVFIGAINDTKRFPLIGINMTTKQGCSFTRRGLFYEDNTSNISNIILSTGKKWEPVD